ncbi:MAG: response regulator [Alteromonadaceae bacterium]|nr:response regulator [Alteromonadaceae bacterium]
MKKTVNFLILDDVDATRELLRGLLTSVLASPKYKFEVMIYQAATAEQAMHLLKKHKISLAFLDIELPDDSGLNVLRNIKNDFPDTHSVMVSGSSSKKNVLAALEVGILGFILKPFNRVRVEEAVENFYKKTKP